MRNIVGQLTPELATIVGDQAMAKSAPLRAATFRDLMQHVARLSYSNKDFLLFFRGQATDHKNKAGASTFYPTIYRGDRLSRSELEIKFNILESACRRLSTTFEKEKIEGAGDVRRRKLIQWSILQHYEVCPTPLIDFTQSVRVACSFALLEPTSTDPFIYVFGLPYLTNRISVNSEHDLVNVRLLSICPPDALRPFFQEGYLVGTDGVTTDYSSKSELDFNNRLIAKFQISREKDFWSGGFDPIPREALYPDNDKILKLCDAIRNEVGAGIQPSELGGFLQGWSSIESRLLSLARTRRDRVFSVAEAIRVLEQTESLPVDLASRLNSIRRTRNMAVHQSDKLKSGELAAASREIQSLAKELKNIVSIQLGPHGGTGGDRRCGGNRRWGGSRRKRRKGWLIWPWR